jgi:hypothetical protein
MKFQYSISFHGTVEDTEGEDGVADDVHEAETAVRDSFNLDLLHGVKVKGMSIHIDEINDPTEQK